MTSRRQFIARLHTILSRAIQRWTLALVVVALLLGLAAEGPPPASLDTRATRMLAGEQFDFVGWEVTALLGKVAQALVAPQRYLNEPARRGFLLDYLKSVADIERLDWEIQRAYTDPQVEDAEAATVEWRARLAGWRAAEETRQPLAEAILEEQMACVLVEEGFGLLSQEIPPVGSHFTPLPLLLVISPRDHIERTFDLSLRRGLDVAQQEAIEEQIDTTLDVSSLVTHIGGMAAYPAMLFESSSLTWLADVTAHEWTHHYLTLRPLGWNYDASSEARTINETVASIVGKEMGRRMIARYYPELLPPEPAAEEAEGEASPSEPPAFDFNTEMRQTRVQVDELLAQGQIEEAEDYMEARRQEFVAQGYGIRKLNQAYFAFHGAYADEPGAAGEDPVGPAVQKLRARSPDLHTFVARVARVTTLAQLEALLGNVDD